MEQIAKVNLIGFPQDRLIQLIKNWEEKPFRAFQVLNWIYNHRVNQMAEMTNISKNLRKKLDDYFSIELPKVAEKTLSKDGTIKYLLELGDGETIESVWMPEEDRKTLCISTQVGCRLGCTFCYTGTLGLKRQLTSAEIIGQILTINDGLAENDKVTNIVIMGMGEPLDNYEALCDALRLMISPEVMRISPRKITLSTSGLVDKIQMFQNENLPVNLAISLNATNDQTRNQIMPINKKFPIAVLLDCLRNYPLKPTRRITFEYVLLNGINDSHEDAVRMAKLLRGIPSKINLIPFNGFKESDFSAPPKSRILNFQNYLISKNYTTFIRKNRGGDILGACGQLVAMTQ